MTGALKSEPLATAPIDVLPERNGRRPLRVCMLHFSNYPVDSRVQRQARALAARGDEVESIGLTGPAEHNVGPGRIRLHNAGVRKRRSGPLAYIHSYSAFFARAARKTAELERERPFDLIEIHNMPNFLTLAGLPARRRGTPVVLDVHDTFPELFATRYGLSLKHPLSRAIELEERIGAAVADAVMVVTTEAGQRLNERGVGVGRTTVVMNSPDEEVFGSARAPRAPHAGAPIRAIYHGGLAPRFGVVPLVHAFALLQDRLPELSLTVRGADHDTEPVVDLVRAHEAGNVFIEPYPTPFKQIPEALEHCHLGIVPTMHDEFTELLLPVKLLEYIHMGLPVVTSRLPVIERYFSSDEVRFFEPGSAKSLADAVIDVIEHPDAAVERTRRAQARLDQFTWAAQRRRYLGLVDALVPARTPRRFL